MGVGHSQVLGPIFIMEGCELSMKVVFVCLSLSGLLCQAVFSEDDRDRRIVELDKKLAAAREAANAVQKSIDSLANELASLRQGSSPVSSSGEPKDTSDVAGEKDKSRGFEEQIVRPDLGGDERDNKLSARPELFIQSRFQTLPLHGTDLTTAPSNFLLTRMESRWSGKVSDKVGIGFELQYHPAPMGAAEEIVNDAFVEYYPSELVTIRAGQFVKPFGFDIQQSSSLREAPERGMFAGYFFPGQRDRGVLVATKLDGLGAGWHGAELSAAVLNGNRFFADNNRQLNYGLRFRKVLDSIHLAFGMSAQIGTQIIPPGIWGSTRENLYGADVQWARGRFGVRAEIAGGNMPSTLIGLHPEFAARFRPGAHSAGGVLFTGFELSRESRIYARYDQFNGDPVSGLNVRAVNIGYLHRLGEHSRVALDYQYKNRPSFNDDLVNTKFQIIWSVMY